MMILGLPRRVPLLVLASVVVIAMTLWLCSSFVQQPANPGATKGQASPSVTSLRNGPDAQDLDIWPKEGATPANFQRLRLGMSHNAVHALLGNAWEGMGARQLVDSELDYKRDTPSIIQHAETALARRLRAEKGPLPWDNGRTHGVWFSKRAVIWVIFEQDKAIWKDLYVATGEEKGPYLLIIRDDTRPPQQEVNHQALISIKKSLTLSAALGAGLRPRRHA
jgi:hypothetical protein